jgi:hypothetical protein
MGKSIYGFIINVDVVIVQRGGKKYEQVSHIRFTQNM